MSDSLKEAYLDEALTDEEKERKKLDEQTRRLEEEKHEGAKFWMLALNSVVGRREIYRLLDSMGTFRSGFTEYAVTGVGFPQDRATDYARGARDAGRRWFEYLEFHHTELVIEMRAEHDPEFAKARDLAGK